jgi:hypothetical protein
MKTQKIWKTIIEVLHWKKNISKENKKLKEWVLKLRAKQMINWNWRTKLKNYKLLSKE